MTAPTASFAAAGVIPSCESTSAACAITARDETNTHVATARLIYAPCWTGIITGERAAEVAGAGSRPPLPYVQRAMGAPLAGPARLDGDDVRAGGIVDVLQTVRHRPGPVVLVAVGVLDPVSARAGPLADDRHDPADVRPHRIDRQPGDPRAAVRHDLEGLAELPDTGPDRRRDHGVGPRHGVGMVDALRKLPAHLLLVAVSEAEVEHAGSVPDHIDRHRMPDHAGLRREPQARDLVGRGRGRRRGPPRHLDASGHFAITVPHSARDDRVGAWALVGL